MLHQYIKFDHLLASCYKDLFFVNRFVFKIHKSFNKKIVVDIL